jgi:arylsulfatase
MRLVTSLAVGLALLGCATVASGRADDRPNFLLIMVDDMGWSDIGCFGSEIETPNIDAIAERGVRFTDFHTSVSCSPTRCMLLTGNDNHVGGLGSMAELLAPNQRGKPGYEGHLNDRVVTLAEVLRDAGYHTYMAGKWHLGHETETYPSSRGFERTFALGYGAASHFDDMSGAMEAETPAHYMRNGKQIETLPADFYSSRSYADFLMDAIREHRADGRPFLAYYAPTAPHDPLHVPEPWLSQYRGRYDDGYDVLRRQRAEAAKRLGLVASGAPYPPRHELIEPWDSLDADRRALESRGMELYAGMMTNVDYHIGRIVQFLRDIGAYDETVVIFLSDNGPNPWASEDYPNNRGSAWLAAFDNSLESIGHPGSNYAYGIGWAAASAGPLDRFKLTTAEGGIRTPLLVAGPGVKGDRQIDSFAYVTDVMPTLLEMAGVEHPSRYRGRTIEPMRGRPLTGILSGARASVYGADEFIGGELGGGKWIRQGAYKAVFVSAPYGSGEWQLFNVVDDPGETRNLAEADPALLEELTEAWDRYAEEVGIVEAEGGHH